MRFRIVGRVGKALLLLALGVGLLACNEGDSSAGTEVVSYYLGEASMALGAAGNEADCATCHSDDGTQDGLSGKTLKDIAYRTSYKGGTAESLLDAVNACVVVWMGGDALEAGDPEWAALEGWLKTLSDSEVTDPNESTLEILENEAAYEASYAGGDAAAGEAKFDTYCGTCHGTGLKLGSARALSLEALADRSIGRIAQKVRTAGPIPSGTADTEDTTPGPMPFFETEDVSTEDLRDIIAYIMEAD